MIRSYRVWRVQLDKGACIAIRPAGATHSGMLATVREQFGAGRVRSIEPERQSEATGKQPNQAAAQSDCA